MRKLFKKKRIARLGKRRNHSLRHDYDVLEDRRVLATLTSLDIATGQLTIDLTSPGDIASVDIMAGLVTVNGSNDLDSSMIGTQSLSAADLRILNVNGDAAMSGQEVQLRGDFGPAVDPSLQTISISNVNTVMIIGNYYLAGNFSALLDSDMGGIDDGQSGRLRVGGETNIDAGNNSIVLDNHLNDFMGAVSLRTIDIGNSAWIQDANDILFDNVMISEDLRVMAGGDITDTDNSIIQVADRGQFFGTNIALGNNTAGTTEIFRVTVNMTGHAELYFDSPVMFFGINNVDSLDVDTDDGISDARKTAINVAGLASLRGGDTIVLGDLEYDLFNAGMLNFNSLGQVSITENSSLQLAGASTAGSLDMRAFGDIADSDDASLNVVMIARFDANNVYLGDTLNDEFNAGSIQFNSVGDMFLNEDSGTHFVESSQANRFELVSNGPITDAVDASLEVATLASFAGTSVMIGESEFDNFRAGWITFNTLDSFFIMEDDSTAIVNLNTAETATIVSTGLIFNGDLARIFVTGMASFSGSEILLGNRTDDNLQFGGLNLNALNSATVFEDDATMFVGNSSAAELNMNSVGSITDADDAAIAITGAASFFSETGGIMLGNSALDEFNTGSLTLDAVNGVANVTEDSDIFLTGLNQSRSLVLNADGMITDDDFASIDLQFLLSVTAREVNLGDTETDFIGFGSLTFNTMLDTSISSQETIILTGTSVAGGQMALSSEGNIFDSLTAQTTADSAILTAINIVLGDTEDACFDVLEENTVVVATGVTNITYGC